MGGVDIVFDLVFLLQGPKHQNMVFTGKNNDQGQPRPKTMSGQTKNHGRSEKHSFSQVKTMFLGQPIHRPNAMSKNQVAQGQKPCLPKGAMSGWDQTHVRASQEPYQGPPQTMSGSPLSHHHPIPFLTIPFPHPSPSPHPPPPPWQATQHSIFLGKPQPVLARSSLCPSHHHPPSPAPSPQV